MADSTFPHVAALTAPVHDAVATLRDASADTVAEDAALDTLLDRAPELATALDDLVATMTRVQLLALRWQASGQLLQTFGTPDPEHLLFASQLQAALAGEEAAGE